MEITKIINDLEDKRIQAQSWFIDKEKRKVSTQYDNRETSAVSILSVETFISFYEEKFNKKPTSILDIGCGQGQVLKYLSQQLPFASLTGIDSSYDAIKTAKLLNINAEFICTDVERISFQNKTFDIIFIHLCFGLFRDPLIVLKNLIPYMSSESLIYIVDLNRECFEEGITSSKSQVEELYLRDQYNAAFSLTELKNLLSFVTEPEVDLTFTIGTSLIGGFNQWSSDFLSLLSYSNLQKALRSISEEDNSQQHQMPDLIHAWVIKGD